MSLNIRDDRQMRALTGLSAKEICKILPVFAEVYQEEQQQAYEQGLAAGTRQRKPGGGQKANRQR
ncbi:MAG: hypothetical protein HS126_00165 [Anaerolineales bacterium]|nr:hypothetical protein [Anaerolineales bacterium]